MGIKQMCEFFLEHSYRYYILDDPIVSDYAFDIMCRNLKSCVEEIPEEYKTLIDEDSLACGSGFHIKEEEYPQHIKDLVGG